MLAAAFAASSRSFEPGSAWRCIMTRWLLLTLLSFTPVLALAANTPFACNMLAMTNAEREQHGVLSRQLFAAVREQRELADGYAFRLPPEQWLPAARWAALEGKCCPFFAFELASSSNSGPLWLRITGPPGAKAFMKEEFGL
jgi:hypothetical protein